MKVLVLDQYADLYQPLLAEVDATCIKNPDSVTESADVLLAQPDFAAAYLNRGFSAAWIQSTWAGVTPLVDIARQCNVVVTGLKGIFGPLIAEYVFAHMLADVTRLSAFASSQAKSEWQPVWPARLGGKRLAIAGTGSIGAHVASVATHFGMHTIGISLSGSVVPGFDQVFPVDRFCEAIGDVDYLLLTLPDTPLTRNLVNEEVLGALPASAMLLNVGRGSTLDETALIGAIKAGSLRRAVLDVFVTEPLPKAHPFWTLPNVTVTPHVAAISYPADVVARFQENLARYQAGEPLQDLIDLKKGY